MTGVSIVGPGEGELALTGRDMIAAGQPMTPAAIEEIMAHYGTQPATTFAT